MHYPGPQVTAAFVPLIVHGGEAAAGAALARGSKQQGRGAPQQQGAAAGPSQPPSLTKSQQARLKHVVKRLKDMFNRLEQQPEACAMRVLVFYEVGRRYGACGRQTAGAAPASGANGQWSG